MEKYGVCFFYWKNQNKRFGELVHRLQCIVENTGEEDYKK
jgi:Zn-dependent peptidase ImmA (M78 family)